MPVRSEPLVSDRRSYAFLIERLLPTHRLDPARRERLAAALAADDRETLHREALAVLHSLETAGLFEERPGPPGTRRFRHRMRGDQIVLTAPPVEQQSSRPPRVTDVETVPEVAAPTQARLHPEVGAAASGAGSPVPSGVDTRSTGLASPAIEAREDVESAAGSSALLGEPTQAVGRDTDSTAGQRTALAADSWKQIEPLLELASIEPQLAPYGDRLRHVVAQLAAALPGAQVRLLCLDAAAAEGLGNGEVEVLDRAEADDVPHYREALRLGETQFATSAPVGADPASGRIAAAVPIYVVGEPWGLMRVTWEQGSVDSVADLARLMAPLSRLVAVAIQNQTMLEQLVFIDALTGVYNRAFYDRQVTLEIERANRTNQKFALLVMDIDDFKPINDRYGHRAGDQVLSQLAREVRGRMRKIDLMFRYGGEEFVLLLPGADLEEAQRTGERLRLVVSEQRFLPEGWTEPLRVTVSIGGAVYPDQSRTRTGIFNAADAALYRAKHEGKNRVRF